MEGLGVGLGLAGGGVGGVVAEAAVRLAKTVADTAMQVGCKHNIDNSSTIRVPVPGHMCHRPRDDADPTGLRQWYKLFMRKPSVRAERKKAAADPATCACAHPGGMFLV